jgi:multidrug efflux pump subunit AcrB
MSAFGMLAMAGVVVNDSLVLVDAVNKQRALGEDVKTAIINAGVIRFRPIILTSLTTFFGLMPLLMEKSTTSQFLIVARRSTGWSMRPGPKDSVR